MVEGARGGLRNKEITVLLEDAGREEWWSDRQIPTELPQASGEGGLGLEGVGDNKQPFAEL